MSNYDKNKRGIFSQYIHTSISRKSYTGKLVRKISGSRKNPEELKPAKSLRVISDQETMVIDPKTGGQKASKDSQIGFIDPVALYELGKVAGIGIQKYSKYNYLKGYDWSLSYNALMRHMEQMWSGEDLDEESGLLHAVHAAWHALALASFQMRDLGTDDRFKG
jgi:hypothetical protein